MKYSVEASSLGWLSLMTFLVGFAPGVAAAEFMLLPPSGENYVESQGAYPMHLQGVTTNQADAIYWSYTNRLIKTDASGKLLKSLNVIDHHGDLTFANGKIYVAVNDRVTQPPGEFNAANPNNPGRQWIFEYDAETLEKTAQHHVPQVTYGAGGIAYHDGRFLVVSGLATGETTNYAYEYDGSFTHLRTIELDTGYTDRGIQTAEFAAGHWWFGTYHAIGAGNDSRQLFKYNESLDSFNQYSFDASLGLAAMPHGRLLVGTNQRIGSQHFGRVELAVPDAELGLKLIAIPVPEPGSMTAALVGVVVAAGLLLGKVAIGKARRARV